MGTTVIVNNMTVSHKGSSGISTAFPDVCKTPAPPAPPVPIPYPNVAMSGDVDKGSKKTKFDGKVVCLKKSKLKTSTGDEAGALKGIVSNKIKGKAAFVSYSFDVKVEGSNVCRLADPTTQNMGSINAAAFFHAQAPNVGVVGEDKIIAKACEKVKKKAKEQNNSAQAVSGVSGIHPPHVSAIQSVVNRLKEWTLYFRKTNPLCLPWIATHQNQPKPHSLTAGKTISGGDVPAVEEWLNSHPGTKQWKRVPKTPIPGQEGRLYAHAATLTGVVRSTLEGDMKNMPHLGTGKLFRRGWITGDYDLMDVQRVGARCQRPTGKEFAIIQYECNKAMRWPGIQHGPQSDWDTKTDHEFKGKEHFNARSILNDWANTDRGNAVANIPKRNIAPGRPDLAIVDSQLTIIGPGGAAYLDTHADYWDALACCGCRSDAQQLKQTTGQSTKKSAGGKGGQKRRITRRM